MFVHVFVEVTSNQQKPVNYSKNLLIYKLPYTRVCLQKGMYQESIFCILKGAVSQKKQANLEMPLHLIAKCKQYIHIYTQVTSFLVKATSNSTKYVNFIDQY